MRHAMRQKFQICFYAAHRVVSLRNFSRNLAIIIEAILPVKISSFVSNFQQCENHVILAIKQHIIHYAI